MNKAKSELKNLRRQAERVTRSIMARLPEELRAQLDSAAVVLQRRPDVRQRAEGIESDCLGFFTGPSLRDGDANASLPPQIFMFLDNILAESLESGRSFSEELRRTFLHELGHYLGLDEEDLRIRDVD